MQKLIPLIIILILNQISFTEAIIPCAANQYSDGTSCKACDSTRESNAGNDTPIKNCKCKAGYASTRDDNSECPICKIGSYSAAGATTCTDCENTRTTSQSGSTSASDCICKIGYYSALNDNSKCTQCKFTRTTSGTGNTKMEDCICQAGYASTKTDNSLCQLCQIGTFAAEGATSCTACEASHTTVSAGKTQITDCVCKEGSYGQNQQTPCTQCDATRTSYISFSNKNPQDCFCKAGYASQKFDNTPCIQCPANSWSTNMATSCTACKNGRTSNAGSTKVTDCKCPNQTNPDNGTSECNSTPSSTSSFINAPFVLMLGVLLF